jgi:CRP/FNR family transcriptional regulator, anaerobic regulatory protein
MTWQRLIFRLLLEYQLTFHPSNMDEEQSLIKQLFEEPASTELQTYSKGAFIIKEGQVEQSLYFIVSGAVRVFHVTEFEEQTIRFGYQGSLITSLSSFITGRPSEFYIQALRKTSLRAIARTKLYEVIHGSSENQRQYIRILESLIIQQMEREIDLLTESPTKRLERVLVRSPNLFQEVPLKYIASYLRMTPETLSRVRNS